MLVLMFYVSSCAVLDRSTLCLDVLRVILCRAW